MDFSQLSDEELEKIANAPSKGPDYASMSDAELERIANPPGKLESFARGAAQGASLGFADEISGALESALTNKTYEQARDESRANFKAAKDANPWTSTAGELAGGVGTALIPGLGAANAAKTLRGAATLGAGLGAATGLGQSEAKDAQGLAVDTLSGAGLGAGFGAAGFGAAKGAEKAANWFGQKLSPALERMMPVGKKANAQEIEEAAKRLGFEATPGMTNASESVQKLESSLHQAPTIGGYLTRRTTGKVGDAMRGTTDDLISEAASVSPAESGDQIKKILSEEVKRKFKPSTDTFNDLAQYTKDIPSAQSSTKAVSRNIMAIPEVDTLELPLARQVVKQLEKNPSVDQIKTLRTMVGAQAKSAQGAEKSAYWQIYAKLGRLEENTLKRGVIQSARNKSEGNDIAAGMLGQLRGAKRGYAGQMGNLEDMAQAARLGKVGNPSGFVDKIDAIPSERLQEKLLPLEDTRLAQTVQNQFPEAFGVLKKARLRDLSEGVIRDGEAVPGKLLQNTKNLNPEAKSMLFGDKASNLSDLRTVSEALPDKVGPSGTQQAFDVAGMLNPVNQARDLARYGAYKAASSETLNKVAQFLRSQPKFANLAEKNPKAFQAAVYQFAQKVNPQGGVYKAAGFSPTSPVDDQQARDAFLEQ